MEYEYNNGFKVHLLWGRQNLHELNYLVLYTCCSPMIHQAKKLTNSHELSVDLDFFGLRALFGIHIVCWDGW
jgi:hypothetical protein